MPTDSNTRQSGRAAACIRNDEVEDWTRCTRGRSPEPSLCCAFKYGDGSQQITAQCSQGTRPPCKKHSSAPEGVWEKKNTGIGVLTAALAAAKQGVGGLPPRRGRGLLNLLATLECSASQTLPADAVHFTHFPSGRLL